MAKRLRPLTAEVSKACVRLLNRPLIEISLLTLARQQIKNFIFGVKGYTNYKSLHDHFESGIGFSSKYHITPRVHIKYQPNVVDYGSADSARINMEYYHVKDPVFAVQGDNIFDIDLHHILSVHRGKKAFMTIGLMPIADVTGYGIADIASDMRISRFVEKPSPRKAPSKLANTGLYLLSPEIRVVFKERKIQEMLKTHNRLDFGYDLIPYLVETGRPVYGYVLQGAWYDIGTPERYLEAMTGILHGQLKSLQDFGGKVSEDASVWIQGESTDSIQRRREIVRKVREGKIMLEGAVLIGRHCQIADGVTIVDSCIDNYSRIERNVVIEGSAVMDRTIIGCNTEIRESIIGRHTTIHSTSDKATRLQNSVVGDDVILGEGCQLITAKVYPHKHIPKESLIENYSIT
jgi:NDP-sugar pyrophosphorylase family protein